MNKRVNEIVALLNNNNLSNEERIKLLVEEKKIFEDYIKDQKEMLEIQQGLIGIMKKINVKDDTGYLENETIMTDMLLDFISGCKMVISNIESEIKSLKL